MKKPWRPQKPQAPSVQLSSAPQDSAPTPSSAIVSLAAVMTAGCLGAGLSEGNGMLYGHAAEWLLAALGCSLVGLIAPAPGVEKIAQKLLPAAWLGAFAYAFILWPVVRPALYLTHAKALGPWTLPTCTGIAAVVAGYTVGARPRFGPGAACAGAISFLILGQWLLAASPAPKTDVVVLHQHALQALVSGVNPHAITFPNIYPDISHYPPGLATRSEVLFGYPYPALNLLWLWPFSTLGDYRLGLLTAYLATGVGLFWLGRTGKGAAALFLCLFMPRALLILENGWTEPVSALCLVAFFLSVATNPRLSAVFLGLFFASKQTMPLLAAAFVAAPQVGQVDWRRYGRWVGATALSVTLPFILIGPKAFWHSVIYVPLVHPFRADAMTLLAWWHRAYGSILPSGIGFVVLAFMSWLVVARLAKNIQGMAYASGLLLLWFVAFNRQGFCNYYFLVIVAMAAAAAHAHVPACDET